MKRSLGGKANKDGFLIIDFDNHIVLGSENCPPQDFAILQKEMNESYDNLFKRYFCALAGSFIVIVLMFLWLSTIFEGWVVFWSLLFPLVIAEISNLIWLIVDTSRMGLKTQQYHGCEHKVIYSLERSWAPTIGNLRQAPRVDLYCGTRNTSLGSFIFPFYGLLLQRLITTREPNLNQLEEGLRVMEKYYQLTYPK